MTLLTAHGMGELAVLIPHLLGYHPGHSLVLLSVRGGRVGPMARLDLSQAPPGESASSDAAQAGLTEAVHGAVGTLAQTSDRLLLFAFEVQEHAALDWERCVSAAATRAGAPLDAALVVRGDRWWHIGQDDAPAGLVPSEADVPAVADLVLTGSAPLASVETFVELLRGTDGDVEAVRTRLRVLRAAAGHRSVRRGLQEWSAILDDRHPLELDVDALARALVALDDLDVRDGVFTWLAPAYGLSVEIMPPRLRDAAVAPPPGIDGHSVGAIRGRLVQVIRSAPPRDRAPVLTLLASHAWQFGDGTMARLAAQEALRVDPLYRMATYLLHLIEHHVRRTDPVSDRPVGRAARRAQGRHGTRAAARRSGDNPALDAASRHPRPATIRYGANRRQ